MQIDPDVVNGHPCSSKAFLSSESFNSFELKIDSFVRRCHNPQPKNARSPSHSSRTRGSRATRRVHGARSANSTATAVSVTRWRSSTRGVHLPGRHSGMACCSPCLVLSAAGRWRNACMEQRKLLFWLVGCVR